jgi:hypothetical protein
MRKMVLAFTLSMSILSTPAQAGVVDYIYGKSKVEDTLKDKGYRSISIGKAFINQAPLQCRKSEIYKYTAILRGKPVKGFACYRGLILGVAHWDD